MVVDWANVYGWKKSLKKEVNAGKLFDYLSEYSQIKSINLYFGKDKNEKSRSFLNEAGEIGYRVITKDVKYMMGRRKCDFDLEICMDVLLNIDKYDGFVFLSGDGDFRPLYDYLIEKQKQLVVMFAKGHLGREVYGMKRAVYLFDVRRLGDVILRQKISPRNKSRGVIGNNITKNE